MKVWPQVVNALFYALYLVIEDTIREEFQQVQYAGKFVYF